MARLPFSRGRLLPMAAVVPLLLGGCATFGHRHAPNPLVRAGFVDRPANTPVRQAMLMRLPPHRFVRHVHGTELRFVYADPSGCDCLYVGSPRSYRRYVARAGGGFDTATDYADPFWDWNAWGGFGPNFHWGPAVGW